MAATALDFYATSGRHTDILRLGIHAADIDEAVGIVQGVLVYDLVAEGFYGVDLSATQAGTVHERDAARILDVALQIDRRPLSAPRQPGARVGGRCNTYTLLTVALLRAAGIPARSRCGFATYFTPGYYEDHWVAEYWDADHGRWVMVDAQLDAVWRRCSGWIPRSTPSPSTRGSS